MYSMGERYWAADSLREPTANCPTRGACLSTAAYTNPSAALCARLEEAGHPCLLQPGSEVHCRVEDLHVP